MGHVFLEANDLCRDSLNHTYKIYPPKTHLDQDAGSLTINFRKVNEADQKMLRDDSLIKWYDML